MTNMWSIWKVHACSRADSWRDVIHGHRRFTELTSAFSYYLKLFKWLLIEHAAAPLNSAGPVVLSSPAQLVAPVLVARGTLSITTTEIYFEVDEEDPAFKRVDSKVSELQVTPSFKVSLPFRYDFTVGLAILKVVAQVGLTLSILAIISEFLHHYNPNSAHHAGLPAKHSCEFKEPRYKKVARKIMFMKYKRGFVVAQIYVLKSKWSLFKNQPCKMY